MDRDSLVRKARLAARVDGERGDAAAERVAEDQRKAAEKLEYLVAQDRLADTVEEWVEYAGVDPSKKSKPRTAPFAQQNQAKNGSATTPRVIAVGAETVERMSTFKTHTSRVIKIGDGMFADDPDGLTDCYVEFFVEGGESVTRLSGRQLSAARTRMPNDSQFDPGRNVIRRGTRRIMNVTGITRYTMGRQHDSTPIEDFGKPYKSAVGARIYRGPAAETILRDGGTPDAHFDESSLQEVQVLDAELLGRTARREIVEYQDPVDRNGHDKSAEQIARELHFAGNTHLPEGAQEQLTQIYQLLEMAAAEGCARAEDM